MVLKFHQFEKNITDSNFKLNTSHTKIVIGLSVKILCAESNIKIFDMRFINIIVIYYN